jgi:hypothetical protein
MPEEWKVLNYALAPVMYVAMSALALAWKLGYLSIVEKGWKKAGEPDLSIAAKLNFDNFLNASRTSDVIVTAITYCPTFVVGIMTFFGVPILNLVFLYAAEILFFAYMFLPMAPTGLMTYSFYWESTATDARITEEVLNFIVWLGMMAISMVFLPELRIWYSKSLLTCEYDSLFDDRGLPYAFGSTWSNAFGNKGDKPKSFSEPDYTE